MIEEGIINNIDISEILISSEKGLVKAFCYTPDFCHTEKVSCVSISPNGECVVSGSYDKTIRIWDLNKNKLKRRINAHDDWINNIVVSPNGKYIVSCSMDKTIRIWEFDTGELLRSFDKFKGVVYSIALSPNGKYPS